MMKRKDLFGVLSVGSELAMGGERSPPLAGSMINSETFGLPVVLETVDGASMDLLMRGEPSLEASYVAAARRLEERGAVMISSYCGAAIQYQEAIARAVNVPVLTSSLILLPVLLRQLSPSAKIGVMTFDARAFREEWLGIADPADRRRVVIGGVEGGKLFHNESMCPPGWTALADIENDIATSVAHLRAANPEIAALLFSCTLFPPAAASIRRSTGLPVYDIVTLCQTTLRALS
ncbi:hypothetical protein NKH48_27660 [Mesorhizobium sp. M1233]|uniref:hypothetical protein n=1 Tax=Mesorhizobium sp. M1233 TaxID=2957072 RepID=UPI00333CBBA5